MRQRQRERSGKALVRLSVVLNEQLSEHVRFRAFQTRKSRSAFVRQLVEEDLRRETGVRPAAADQ